jgi:hypothetical protein
MFTIHFDAAISRNRIRLTNSRTAQTIDRTAVQPFSSEHKLIADREVASRFLRELIRESDGRWRFLRVWATASVSVVREPNIETNPQELRDLFVEQGFARIQMS